MMTSTKAFLSRSMMSVSERAMGRFMRNADGHVDPVAAGGAKPADAPVDGDKPASPESVLFPKDAEPKPADPAGEKKPDDKPADWKEYENDPAKSEAENATAKAEHDKTKPADDKSKDAAKLAEVPEDGKYTVTMPEGIELDQERMDALGPVLAKHKLSHAAVQEIMDAEIKLQQKRADDYASKPEGQWSMAAHQYFTKHGTPDKWVDVAKADKAMGGDNWAATEKAAVRAINHIGTPALKEYLTESGGGNHPELIRAFAKVGGMIKEDVPPTGGAEGQGKPTDAASILFPNDVPKG
jgi:antitoxin component HigA of HigAB toxin-antitoxin module